MNNLALLIEYDGTRYAGWQRQKNEISIQQSIEDTLTELVGESITIAGAGRTDSGVHAKGQVASCVYSPFSSLPFDKLKIIINSRLPSDIRVLDVAIAPEDFNARFSAIYREYEYYLRTEYSVFSNRFHTFVKFPIDENKLFEIGKVFVGQFNFSSFSKINIDTKNYTCRVEICLWSRNEDSYKLTIRADRFVYGMVRSIVGSMIDYARGKRSLESIQIALNSPVRTYESPLAPAQGLILSKIGYPQSIFS